MKNSVANLLTVILLCFYALYTGFSPSVMRAVIMASILLLSKMLGRRYDLLNTVSGAVCLILITQPVYLFESGFILSVSAVYGIALFNKPILTALLSKKVPSFIAKTLAVSISVQIGIVPATIVIFKSIQVYTLLANLIILPIVSVIFILMLVGLFFVLLFDGFIFILMIASIPLAFVDMVSQLIAKLAFSSVYIVQTVPIAIFILCYFLYFLASRFVLQPKGKLKKGISIASLILCGVMLFSGVVSTLLIDNGNYVMAIDCYGGTTSVVCVDDKVYIVGDVSSYSALYSAIRKYNINSIDAILLTSLDDESATEIAMLNNRYNIGAIYSFINTDISGLKTLAQNGITVFKTYDAGETVVEEFSPIIVDYELLGYEFLTENGSIVFCSYNKKYTDLPFDVINRTIAIRCFMYLDCYSDRIFMTNASVNFNGADRSDVQYSNWDIGSYVFEYESGKTILLS